MRRAQASRPFPRPPEVKLSSYHLMVPWWLERQVDFVNHVSCQGAYVGGASQLDDPPTLESDFASAARQGRWRYRRPRSRASSGATLRAQVRRDFVLGLTILLDDARTTALRWRPNDPSRRNGFLQQPCVAVRDVDVQNTRLLVDQWASSQRVLDLFGRLEPLAVAPVFENGAGLWRSEAPRLLHGGQGQLLSRLFEQLPAGATVDFGLNHLTAAQFAHFRLGALRDPYALNLSDNAVDRAFLRHVLAAGVHSLRHLSCRNGLQLDQGDVDILAKLLSQLPHLESLELGLPAFSVTGSGPTNSRVFGRPLRYAGLYATRLPQLRKLFLRLGGQPWSDLTDLDLLAYPRLERLGLHVKLSHETLRAWRPVPPASLAQVAFLPGPEEGHRAALRQLFRDEEEPSRDFEPFLGGWSGFFERFRSELHSPDWWSLCRAPGAARVLQPTWQPDPAEAFARRAGGHGAGPASVPASRSFGGDVRRPYGEAGAPGASLTSSMARRPSATLAALPTDASDRNVRLSSPVQGEEDAFAGYDENGHAYVIDPGALEAERRSPHRAPGLSDPDPGPSVVYGEAH